VWVILGASLREKDVITRETVETEVMKLTVS
jgi:hypothetical protein